MYTNKTNIEKTVERLLHRHECVILPDFGGFIVRDSPCNFNASNDVLKPFAKHIFFNPHLVQNDGLLVSEIQKTEGLGYNDALEYCKSSIEYLRNEIDLNNRISFGKLGSFHKGQSNIWFSPNTEVNLSIESYGLNPINIVQVHSINQIKEEAAKNLKVNTTEIIADKSPIVSLELPKRGLKPWLVAASVALIAHFIYLGVENNTTTTQEASIIPNIELTKPKANLEVLPEVTVEEIKPNIEIENTEMVTPAIESPVVEESITHSDPIEKSSIQKEEPIVFEIKNQIIARYRIEGNANYHAADLNKKGQTANVLKNGDWFEVVIPQ